MILNNNYRITTDLFFTAESFLLYFCFHLVQTHHEFVYQCVEHFTIYKYTLLVK